MRKRAYLYFFLFAFLFVQIPFTLFHHHEVFECSATREQGKTHLHSYLNDDCFVCSAYLLKDYEVSESGHDLAPVCFNFRYLISGSELYHLDASPENSRAPPSFFS